MNIENQFFLIRRFRLSSSPLQKIGLQLSIKKDDFSAVRSADRLENWKWRVARACTRNFYRTMAPEFRGFCNLRSGPAHDFGGDHIDDDDGVSSHFKLYDVGGVLFQRMHTLQLLLSCPTSKDCRWLGHGDVALYQPNCQTNSVIVPHELLVLFYKRNSFGLIQAFISFY